MLDNLIFCNQKEGNEPCRMTSSVDACGFGPMCDHVAMATQIGLSPGVPMHGSGDFLGDEAVFSLELIL